jgi:hypothetical protein
MVLNVQFAIVAASTKIRLGFCWSIFHSVISQTTTVCYRPRLLPLGRPEIQLRSTRGNRLPPVHGLETFTSGSVLLYPLWTRKGHYLPLITCVLQPALTFLCFQGDNKHLDDLVSRLNVTLLDVMSFNRLVFEAP